MLPVTMGEKDETEREQEQEQDSQGKTPMPAVSPTDPPRRFHRTDGRFDLPVVTGRTPQQVARRLA